MGGDGIGDRGSVRPFGNQIKVVTERRSSSKEKSSGIWRNEPYNYREF